MPKSPNIENLTNNTPFENFEDISQNVFKTLNNWIDEPRNSFTEILKEPDTRTLKVPNHEQDEIPEKCEDQHESCSVIVAQNGGEILTKLPYGWTKSYFEPENLLRSRKHVMFRSPARDCIKTKEELKQYFAEHNINHIRLSSFDFCPYNAGSLCTNLFKEHQKIERETLIINMNNDSGESQDDTIVNSFSNHNIKFNDEEEVPVKKKRGRPFKYTQS